jgi:hypothetical protein
LSFLLCVVVLYSCSVNNLMDATRRLLSQEQLDRFIRNQRQSAHRNGTLPYKLTIVCVEPLPDPSFASSVPESGAVATQAAYTGPGDIASPTLESPSLEDNRRRVQPGFRPSPGWV